MADILFLAQGMEAAITSPYGLTVSSYAPGYPGTNLLDRNMKKTGKVGNSATWIISIDLGSSRACSAIGLINANAYSQGWTLGVQHDDNWAFSSPTWVSLVGSGTPAATDEPIFFREFTLVSDQYWRIYCYMTPPYLAQIGFPLLGKPFISEVPYNRPITKGSQYGIDVIETKGGQRYRNKRHGDRRLWIPANFSFTTQAEWDALYAYLWQASEGGLYPVLFRDTDGSLHWVSVNVGGGLSWTHEVYNVWEVPLTLETEL